MRNKRSIKIKQARQDIAQLLGNGQHQNCFKRVDFLFQEQNLLDGYDMVVKFCECILERLSYIRRHKDRPQDINEAVSSLIYASARCADLPELLRLRSLFAKRYGYEFASAAVYLHHNSCVNQQIIEQLPDRLPDIDSKLKLLKGIAVEFNLQWDSSNIEADFGEPTKDSLGGSGGSKKFNSENSKCLQDGVDSSFHPSFNDATYVDSTYMQSVNDGRSNINEFSDSIEKKRSAYFNEDNEKSALHVGCEDQIFERDIPVVYGSVQETFVETSSLEKTERLPCGIGLINRYHNVGPGSNGHGFVKGASFDSCSIDNNHSEDLGYNNGSAAEPPDGATSQATNLLKISKSQMEVKHSDSLDYTSENEEDVSDKKMLQQSDAMPLQSKHSSWAHTAENGYSRIQTCSPQRREVLVDRDSELRSARYSSPSKSQKTKLMQTSSDCYREKQGVHNYLKRHVNTRSSPTSNTDVKKVGDGSIEFDERRWCSPKQKDTKIERLVIVDDTEVSERYPEGGTMRDKGCYFKDYIEVDGSSRLGDRLKHQNSSRTRKKIRRESRRRHSISSHYPIEINSLYPDYNNSADSTFPMPNRSGHFKTVSSKNENRAGVFYTDDFVKTEGGVTVRKYSDCGTNIRVMAQPLFEDKVRSVSRNGHRTSYDMIDSYIDSDSDSDVEISIIPQNIYQVRDCPSPGYVQLHGKKTIQRGEKENEQRSFEEEHDIRKVCNKDKSNMGKQRSNETSNGFQPSENDELLNGTYSSRKQIFYPSKEIHIARFIRDRPLGPHQNGDEATLHSLDDSGEDMLYGIDKTYTSSSVGMHPYKLQQRRGDSTLHSLDGSQSPKNNDHLENNDEDVEQKFQQSNHRRQWSNPTLMRHSKSQEIHCKGGKTLENKPQKGRKESLNLCHKDNYDCDIDSSDSEDQYARQSHPIRKVRKAEHMTNSESVRRRSFDYRFHDNKPRGGSSKLLEENCEEPEFGGNIYDESTARRIGNFCSPRVSFVYIDRPGKAQQQPSSVCYMEENEYNQACIERHRMHGTDCFPTKERQQSNGANLKNRISTYNLARDELKNPLYEASNVSKSRNPPSTADQVESYNQHVCEEKTSMGDISTSLMHQNTDFVKRNSDAASVATPRRPPLSPATPSLSSGFRSCGRPSSPASPSVRPPQRPPPKLPCRWERVVSLPPERSNASPVKSAVRSQSMQTSLSKETTSNADSPCILHVHPKLPDYDDLAAKFMAMKEHHRASTASE
ncbi:uncharacterized protein LOC131040010 isoform X2 [Cryptomeria japonica]|nr:uncharacterized protein LOC131040010 isoform X2 [Cryptomeria japonica]